MCTQPRRLAAIAVAERVSEEFGERDIGVSPSLVGYQIRLDKRVCKTTQLLFCTTGILLRRLQSDPSLSSVTHVILDEVHERDINCDVLLCVLRSLSLKPRRRPLKILLMSATISTKQFSSYFSHCPILTIPGRLYPVTQRFLPDILEVTGHIIEAGSKCSKAEKEIGEEWYSPDDDVQYSDTTIRSMTRVLPHVINYDLIEDLLQFIVQDEDTPAGAILVFLPGLSEITRMSTRLKANRRFDPEWILSLHSSLPASDQKRIFTRPPAHQVKIILSTNIAETSVTIDDVTVVVDSGRVKMIDFVNWQCKRNTYF